ncbi:MAG: hypothetical protein Q9188_001497 [Gyalolechia gomerana]
MADADYVSFLSYHREKLIGRLLTISSPERRGSCWYVEAQDCNFTCIRERCFAQKVIEGILRRCFQSARRVEVLTTLPSIELKKKRAFRKFSYRGIDLDQYVLPLTRVALHIPSPQNYYIPFNQPLLNTSRRLLDLSSEQLRDIVHARARRRFNRGLKRKPMGLIKKLRRAKQNAKPNEKPDLVKTHLRDMIVVPEMIGSVIGIYSGKEYNQVEIKPEMVGFYLGEFSISYKPVKHGRPGIGATHSSRFIPLK